MNEQYVLYLDNNSGKYEFLLYLGEHPLNKKQIFQTMNYLGNFTIKEDFKCKVLNKKVLKFLTYSQLLELVQDAKDILNKKIEEFETDFEKSKNKKLFNMEEHKKRIIFNIQCCEKIIDNLNKETLRFPILSIENSLLIENYLKQINFQKKGLRRFEAKVKKYAYENRTVLNKEEISRCKKNLNYFNDIEKYLKKIQKKENQ